MNASVAASTIETIFHAALDCADADARQRYLAHACDGDTELRLQIERLLAAYDESTADFLERGRRPAPASLGSEQAGETIGRFRLIERLGEGAFGQVWRAEQSAPVRRQVALKIIKLGMDTREVIARFEQERQALAILSHPNIARVFDAGATNTGRPFFAMELVEGVRITEFCDAHRLPVAERLRLFVQVCQAVQHAHQKGIIHRDLKPSNILVTQQDGLAVPKVIDFGVAKATQQKLTEITLVTQCEQVIGTPHYLSPEQAGLGAGDIDTRSDIYSLGVLLYELLTARLPFAHLAGAALDELRCAIREQEPPPASAALRTTARDALARVANARDSEIAKLVAVIRGDLDSILARAMEKDRSRRYQTVGALAADIERYLAGEPVAARPPARLYRLGKLVRRNKVAFAAAAAVTAALLVGTAVSTWQAMRANAALRELAAAAPGFFEQARALIVHERFDEAIEKLDYAAKLRPDSAEYFAKKGDLLQCQLRLKEAAQAYRAALRLDPQNAQTKANLTLCEALSNAHSSGAETLSTEQLSKLYAAMLAERRSAAELLPIGRLLGRQKELTLTAWRERLKDLPLPADRPLGARLGVRNDGLLTLDLSGTTITNLDPLRGMPLAELNCQDCANLSDLTPLRGLPLRALNIERTNVYDLAAIAGSRIEQLELAATKVVDLEPLRGMPLKVLRLPRVDIASIAALGGMRLEDLEVNETRVTDLQPLVGMPLRRLVLDGAPMTDLSPLRGLPLEYLSMRFHQADESRVPQRHAPAGALFRGCGGPPISERAAAAARARSADTSANDGPSPDAASAALRVAASASEIAEARHRERRGTGGMSATHRRVLESLGPATRDLRRLPHDR